MTFLHRSFIAALLFLTGIGARASENVFLVSDTVGYLEKTFGVRAKATAWFVESEGSGLNFSFPGKGAASFHLTQKPPDQRSVDQIQIEPAPGAFPIEKAAAYGSVLAGALQREGWGCSLDRHDQDGINAFYVYTCVDKSVALPDPITLSVTLQSVGGRNLVFVQFARKKR